MKKRVVACLQMLTDLRVKYQKFSSEVFLEKKFEDIAILEDYLMNSATLENYDLMFKSNASRRAVNRAIDETFCNAVEQLCANGKVVICNHLVTLIKED